MISSNILLLKMGQTLLGVEVPFVREVVDDIRYFPTPIEMPDISHLVMLRGKPNAILNTEYFFSLEHTERSKIVFLTGEIALFVDEAVQILHLNELDQIEGGEENYPRFIKQVMNYRNKVVPIIDIKEILKDDAEPVSFSV